MQSSQSSTGKGPKPSKKQGKRILKQKRLAEHTKTENRTVELRNYVKTETASLASRITALFGLHFPAQSSISSDHER